MLTQNTMPKKKSVTLPGRSVEIGVTLQPGIMTVEEVPVPVPVPVIEDNPTLETRNIIIEMLDEDDAPIEGATIWIAGTEAGMTGEDGRLTVENIYPGTYLLSAEADGFTPIEDEEITVI